MKYIIPFLVLSACATTTPSLPTAQEDTCNANSHAALVGQQATALEKVLILGMVRTIRPDDIVTMDYRQERINFRIDANEIITSVTCG